MKKMYTGLFLLSIPLSFAAGWYAHLNLDYTSLMRKLKDTKPTKQYYYVNEEFNEQRKLQQSLEVRVVDKKIDMHKKTAELITIGDDKNYYQMTLDLENETGTIKPIISDKQASAQYPGVF